MRNSTPDVLASGTHCPTCAATVRPDAPWCTLCYTDLRPAAPSAPDTTAYEPPPAVPLAPAFDPLTAPAEAFGLPARHAAIAEAPAPEDAVTCWPCSACSTDNPLTESVCSACGSGFLAALRDAEGPLLVVPGVGDLAALSRPQRLGFAAGLVVLVSLLTALLALLTG